MTSRRYARPAALALLKEHAGTIETARSLLMAAVAVSMHELDDVSPEGVERQVQSYADRVLGRVKGSSTSALLAHLHELLFEELGFAGNLQDYYNPLNSYLPAVLANRRGLPITLSLVYKVVGERAGLAVRGINAPLHFMAGVEAEGKLMLVDPFDKGRVLTPGEAAGRIERVAGRAVANVEGLLPVATHRQWIVRILNNLINVFRQTGQEDELRAMLEMREMISTQSDK